MLKFFECSCLLSLAIGLAAAGASFRSLAVALLWATVITGLAALACRRPKGT